MSADGAPIRVGLVGFGQIARVQHVPALAGCDGLQLTAIANPVPVRVPEGVALHDSLDSMLAAPDAPEAVAICTPPQARYRLARQALQAGRHVLLEKPPAATPAEAASLAELARARGVSLFTAWHSVFNEGVARARDLLARQPAQAMRLVWKEDVDFYHPGVDWFWQPGGMGVFDAGINALSILVATSSEPLFIRSARLHIPEGAHTPVRAELELATPTRDGGFAAELDWNHKGQESWTITWTLADGSTLSLERGGALLRHDGALLVDGRDEEYPGLYRRFRELVTQRRCHVELRPLQLVADAFMLARRIPAPAIRSSADRQPP